MKKKISVWDYAGTILSSLPAGILLTTKDNEKVNTMTIGWGKLGIEWARPVFIAYVRQSRLTHDMLEENGEFTVNVPIGEIDKEITRFCGTKSGRSIDKIKAMNLTLEDPESISVPGIRELPLTLECRVIYKQDQDLNALPQDMLDRFYPLRSADDSEKRDFHTAYYGEIVSAYIIE